jgi:hypothetical protein
MEQVKTTQGCSTSKEEEEEMLKFEFGVASSGIMTMLNCIKIHPLIFGMESCK